MGARRSLRNVKNAQGLPLTHDDVMIPLGRAKAALWLLNAMEGGHVTPPDEHVGWLRSICLDVVAAAITESEEAYCKAAAQPKTETAS
jgi:hypothetical protein